MMGHEMREILGNRDFNSDHSNWFGSLGTSLDPLVVARSQFSVGFVAAGDYIRWFVGGKCARRDIREILVWRRAKRRTVCPMEPMGFRLILRRFAMCDRGKGTFPTVLASRIRSPIHDLLLHGLECMR
jgi:hypothetical protein